MLIVNLYIFVRYSGNTFVWTDILHQGGFNQGLFLEIFLKDIHAHSNPYIQIHN